MSQANISWHAIRKFIGDDDRQHTAMISWDTCKMDFGWDGSLRDIYVAPASLDDWRTIYPLLRSQSDIEFVTGAGVRDIPETLDGSFFADVRPTLRFRIGGVLVVFHFFTPDEIECDIDPREVTCQAQLDSLLAFVRQIGDLTHKQAVLTPENLREEPIISYDPKTKTLKYHGVPKPPEPLHPSTDKNDK